MRNEFESWLKGKVPAGQAWTGRLLAVAAAGTATATVWLSVVLMAGLGLPPGEAPVGARAPAVQTAGPEAGQTVRQASALPIVTVVGRREPGDRPLPAATTAAAAPPARPAPGDTSVRMSAAGDPLRQ